MVKTNDFIHYSIPQRQYFAWDSWYDKDGCYSGSAIVIEDKLELFYTGNTEEIIMEIESLINVELLLIKM